MNPRSRDVYDEFNLDKNASADEIRSRRKELWETYASDEEAFKRFHFLFDLLIENAKEQAYAKLCQPPQEESLHGISLFNSKNDWEIKEDRQEFLIFHPKFAGNRKNISISNIKDERIIILPTLINNDKAYSSELSKLKGLCQFQGVSVIDNADDFLIPLPNDDPAFSLRILETIYRICDLPKELSDSINEKMNPNGESQKNRGRAYSKIS